MDNLNEINFSLQEVINLTASIIGTQPQDLIEKIEDNDLSTADSLGTFLKPFTTKFKNELREEALNKGFRQSAKRTEKLWAEVFQTDITGKKLEDLFMEQKQALSDKPKDKSKITLQQALQSDEVRQHIEQLKGQADKYEDLNSSFDSYKRLQSIKQDALDELTNRGAVFSSNPKLKSLQMKALEDELSTLKFKRDANGSIIILDEDGESPLYNKDEASNWNFGDYLQTNSPLEFKQKEPQIKDKSTFVPDNKVGNNQSFGYSQKQLNALGFEDWERAHKGGDLQKAEFIQAQMIKNHENQTNNNK